MSECAPSKVPMLRLTSTAERCVKANRKKLTVPDEVAKFIREAFPCAAQEHFGVIYLDPTNTVLGASEVSRGGLASVQVDPKVLFAGALLAGATGLIISHNHPSGETKPSKDDDELTQAVLRGGKLLTIALVDHIVVSPTDYFSYRMMGRLR